MPADPFEAELLAMAAAVAGEEKDSSSSEEDNVGTYDDGNLISLLSLCIYVMTTVMLHSLNVNKLFVFYNVTTI